MHVRKALFPLLLIPALAVFSRTDPKERDSSGPAPFNPGPPLNGPTLDFAPAIAPDGSYMVFNSNRRDGRTQDLYIAYWSNGRFGEPQPLTGLNSTFNDETPFITASGKTILFASDRDGSQETRGADGKIRVSFDIWFATRTATGWSTPRPVPGGVNTAQHERAPAIAPDGTTLTFTRWPFGNSSASMIFSSKPDTEGYPLGTPLPPLINSGNQEMGLVHGDDGVYFSSARAGGMGGMDIWFVAVSNMRYGTQAVNLGPFVNSPSNEFFYTRNGESAWFCSNREGGLGQFDIYKAGFNVEDIHFEWDSAEISAASRARLAGIATLLAAYPLLRFEIVGHTDHHGEAAYNLALSERRARAVLQALVAAGIAPARLTARGVGMREPVVPGTSPEAAARNRRTEFRLRGALWE